MSDTPEAIHTQLALVMADVSNVGKNQQVQAGPARFNFRGIDAVLNAVGPVLRKHEVYLLPEVLSQQSDIFETGGGKRSLHVVITMAYHFVSGRDGSRVTATVIGESSDTGDKGYTKAASVALRTALIQTLALPTDEPDPDETIVERVNEAEALRTRIRAAAVRLKIAPADIAARFQSDYDEDIRRTERTDALQSTLEALEDREREQREGQVARATEHGTGPAFKADHEQDGEVPQ